MPGNDGVSSAVMVTACAAGVRGIRLSVRSCSYFADRRVFAESRRAIRRNTRVIALTRWEKLRRNRNDGFLTVARDTEERDARDPLVVGEPTSTLEAKNKLLTNNVEAIPNLDG